MDGPDLLYVCANDEGVRMRDGADLVIASEIAAEDH